MIGWVRRHLPTRQTARRMLRSFVKTTAAVLLAAWTASQLSITDVVADPSLLWQVAWAAGLGMVTAALTAIESWAERAPAVPLQPIVPPPAAFVGTVITGTSDETLNGSWSMSSGDLGTLSPTIVAADPTGPPPPPAPDEIPEIRRDPDAGNPEPPDPTM